MIVRKILAFKCIAMFDRYEFSELYQLPILTQFYLPLIIDLAKDFRHILINPFLQPMRLAIQPRQLLV